MIRIAVLLSLAAILTILSLGFERSPDSARALVNFEQCHAKIGVVDDEGFHPWLWGYAQMMNFSQQPKNQNGSRDFTLAPVSGSAPIPISGTIAANGDASGSGSGTYSVPASVTYLGSVTYFDEDRIFPRRIIGDYKVGAGGELPGGKTIVMRVDCWFDPPEELSDPDNDDIPGMRHDNLGFNSASAGRLDDSLMAMVYRDGQGVVQNVEIADPEDVTTQDIKGGPFETSTIRGYYDYWGMFGGSFSPDVSNIDGTLPPEIGSPSITSVLSGVLAGRFRMGYRPVLQAGAGEAQPAGDAPQLTVVSFDFSFHAHGHPFYFLDTSSGDWSWRSDPDREIAVTSLNLATGTVSLTVPVLLDADNLHGIYPETPAQAAGADELPGEPLRFTENVNIAFPPLALITSAMDNCPDFVNVSQADADADGVGDACEGTYWVDADCDTSVGPDDALATLARRTGVTIDPFPAACDAFGTEIGDLTVGDWDCDGSEAVGDVLIPLLVQAGLPLPASYPATCPPPGDFVPRAPPV